MTARLLLYGATGYTGQLIARAAKTAALPLILAGRNHDKLQSVAATLGFPYRTAPLEDELRLRSMLQNVNVVINAAGPFSETAQPLVDACLQRGVHYLDVTGEISVFAALFQRGDAARHRQVMLMPGVGHVIVPSDCLAAHVGRRLPGACHLRLAISQPDFISRGSLRTMLTLLSEHIQVRRQGRLTTVPIGSLRRDFDFGRGPSACTAVSWPDVFTAFHSTGIPNITAYSEATALEQWAYTVGGRLAPFIRGASWKELWQAQSAFLPDGPLEKTRCGSVRTIVAEVEDRQGRRTGARLHTPDGYTFTGTTVLAVVTRVLAGEVESGFHTPGQLFGADFVLALDGVTREDLPDG